MISGLGTQQPANVAEHNYIAPGIYLSETGNDAGIQTARKQSSFSRMLGQVMTTYGLQLSRRLDLRNLC